MKKFIVTLTLFFLLSIPAHALMSFGDIENAKNMSYSDLNFSGNYVTVTIENDNDAPVRFVASMVFATLFDEVLGEALVVVSMIPPKGEVTVREIIRNGDPKKCANASKLFWVFH